MFDAEDEFELEETEVKDVSIEKQGRGMFRLKYRQADLEGNFHIMSEIMTYKGLVNKYNNLNTPEEIRAAIDEFINNYRFDELTISEYNKDESN